MNSMTGYGSGSASFPGGRASVELRAVNHRFLELKMTLPRDYLSWEHEWRELVGAWVKRGRIELTLTFTGRPTQAYTIAPNRDLALMYCDAVRQLQRELGIKGDLDVSFLTTRPDFFQIIEKPQPTRDEVQAARKALQRALEALARQRNREGMFLKRELRSRIVNLEKARQAIAKRSPLMLKTLREKLRERLASTLQEVQIDQSRLLQEIVTLTQKSDITEELVRLSGHLAALRETLHAQEPVGKRIDFLLQEVQREFNTIGAKADDTAIRHFVVTAKEEVEKLREQVQNVE
jgi:uncharacterized protein (TIGR00255 family)